MEKPKRIRAESDSRRCIKQVSKKTYFKKRGNPNKEKIRLQNLQ